MTMIITGGEHRRQNRVLEPVRKMLGLDEVAEGAFGPKADLLHGLSSKGRGDESEMPDFFLELATAINRWLSWSLGLIETRATRGDAMRIGISLTSNHPVAKNPRQGARWMIERTAAAHRAGLDSLFLGEHHVSPTPYYQNTPMLGRLLAEWGSAPPGAYSCSPCGTRFWWLNRSVRWPLSLRAPLLCNAGSAMANPSSPPWAPT